MDYYSEAQQIVDMLRAEGVNAPADSVEKLLNTGASATEILMGIRFHLKATVSSCRDETAARIRLLLREVDRALK